MSEVNRQRRDLALALAFAALPFAWLVARWSFVCDDAYISFRYARHLVEGAGLRFNLGEQPPVEGYTNLLWVLWLAPFEALGAPLELVARATSIASGAALVALTTRFAQRRLELEQTATVATALFLATLPPVSVWCTSGLETMPFALAVFASFDALAREPERPRGARAGVCALVAALLRADGALLAGAALVAGWSTAAGRGWRQSSDLGNTPRAPIGGTFGARAGDTDSSSSSVNRRRALLIALAILVVGVGAQLLWRHAYHGDWLPNTAKVKAGFSALRLERGFKYVATVALTALAMPLALAAALAMRGGPRRGLAASCVAVVTFVLAYAVFVGGDFMPMGRFLVPAMPFVALLAACAFEAMQARAGGRTAIVGATALALLASSLPALDRLPVPRSWLSAVHFRWNVDEPQTERERWANMASNVAEWRALGRGVAEYTQPGESIVLGNIGAIGYESEIFVHDYFGLVDREVAARSVEPRRLSPGHDKIVAPRFFFPRRPTYLGTIFVPIGAAPSYRLDGDYLQLLQRGVLTAEDQPAVEGCGAPAGHVQRFFRCDWSKSPPRKSR